MCPVANPCALLASGSAIHVMVINMQAFPADHGQELDTFRRKPITGAIHLIDGNWQRHILCRLSRYRPWQHGAFAKRILSKSAAKAAVAAAAATTAGRAVSQLATFWIPFANLAINASTAVGMTEFIGWTLATEFAEQASTEDA